MAFNILGSSMVFCQYKLSSASTSYLSLRRTMNTGGSCGVSLQLLTSNVVAGYVHVQRLSNLWATKEFLYCMHFQMIIKSSLKDQRLQITPSTVFFLWPDILNIFFFFCLFFHIHRTILHFYSEKLKKYTIERTQKCVEYRGTYLMNKEMFNALMEQNIIWNFHQHSHQCLL